MKKAIILTLCTVALSVGASAHNLDQGGEQDSPKEEKYTFSINSDFLSIFTLFCIKESRLDSTENSAESRIPFKAKSKD